MYYKDNFPPSISNQELFTAIQKEKETIGYYSLPQQETTAFKAYAKTSTHKNVVVIGIGGSTLGTSAIYDFLRYSKELTKKLYFLESTDPVHIEAKLDRIDLNDTLFVVISKSGTTVETIALFKYIHTLVTIDKTNTLIITEDDSKLNSYAQANAITTFEIPKNVGGRFSVFSAVGLLPLAIVGIDIDTLLEGIKEMHDSFFAQKSSYERLLKKARFLVEHKHTFNINVLFSYASSLESFNKWYIQLWGESLGKIDPTHSRQGLTPIGIIGPVDQHSFLQLIIEGKRDKTVTIIKIEHFPNRLKIPHIPLKNLEALAYLDGIEFSTLINLQADATIEAIDSFKDIPYDVVCISTIDESSIGQLMFEYELLTSLCGQLMNINTYNQPGVESGKIILKNKLMAL